MGGGLTLRGGHAMQALQYVGRRPAVGVADGDRFGKPAGAVENVRHLVPAQLPFRVDEPG